MLAGDVTKVKTANDANARRAAWLIVVRGLQVLEAAEKQVASWQTKTRRKWRDRGAAAAHVLAWRQLVQRGGPARANSLGRLALGVADVRAVSARTVFVEEAGSAADRLSFAVAAIAGQAEVDTRCWAPARAWCLCRWLWQWRAKAEEERQRHGSARAARVQAGRMADEAGVRAYASEEGAEVARRVLDEGRLGRGNESEHPQGVWGSGERRRESGCMREKRALSATSTHACMSNVTDCVTVGTRCVRVEVRTRCGVLRAW